MDKTKIIIIKEKQVTNIYNYLEKELKIIKNKNIKTLLENKFLIDGEDYYFYPITMDTEIEPKGGVFLIGLFFPFSDTAFFFIVDKMDSDAYIKWVRSELLLIFDFFKNNSFTDYKNEKNEKIYPILVGHNIIEYDFLLLFHYMFLNTFYKDLFDNLNKINNIIINSPKEKYRYKIFSDAKNVINREIHKFFCLDTLLCIDKNEGKNLFKYKTEIFFNLNKSNLIPLEFDLKNTVFKSDDQAVNHLCKYNLNDLYFTYLLIFFSVPKDRIKSRCLLYKTFNPTSVNFAKGINEPDSLMNSLCIIEKAGINRSSSYVGASNITLSIKDCIFLHEYFYLHEYLNFFKNKNIYKFKKENEKLLKIKNINVKIGVGGLHSVQDKFNKSEKLGYYGSQLTFSSSNETHMVMMLDFQSFYVNIILKLLDKVPALASEKKILQELNDIRLELKKNKDPKDAIFKVSTLAYTGSLNDYRNKVFYPKLYYSMTLNGQLLCLELINCLSKKIKKVLEVNTDGIIIYFEKKNYNNIIKTCDDFEKKYSLKIDTRISIKYGFFLSSNQKIIFNENNEKIIKGFKGSFGLNFFPETLLRWVSSNVKLFEKFENTPEYKKKLYISLWASFRDQVAFDIKNNNIKNYLHTEKVDTDRCLFYFSKTPNFFGGLPFPYKVVQLPHPIKELTFQDQILDVNFKKKLKMDLDISSYWLYLINKLSSNFIDNAQNDRDIVKPILLNDYYLNFNSNNNIAMPYFYLKNKKIIYNFNLLANIGFVVFMKDRDKKSFPKTKMKQSDLINIVNKNKTIFYKYMIKNYPEGMLNGVAICVNLKETWVNNICCLDFDGVEWFFKEENFNEKNNLKQKNFLNFILFIKKNGFLIFSSMTNTPFDRFKIFFKIKNKPNDLLYKKFSLIHKKSSLNFDFNIEELSSICGSNLYGQKLINKYEFKNLVEVDFKQYNDFFEDTSNTLVNKNENIKNFKYSDLLIDLFEERTSDQRFLYNGLLEKNKKVNLFNFNKYKIDKKIFIYIFIEVVKKNNFNKLNINNIKNILFFYKFNYDPSDVLEKIEKNNPIINNNFNREKLKPKKVLINKDLGILKLDTNFLTSIQNVDFDNYEIKFHQLEEIIIILNNVFSFFNKKYGTNFIYTELMDENIIYHSNCIFKEDNNNNKQVTAFINKHFQCRINCYHDSCKENVRYKYLENSINSNLYSILVSNTSTPFEIDESDITDIIKKLL